VDLQKFEPATEALRTQVTALRLATDQRGIPPAIVDGLVALDRALAVLRAAQPGDEPANASGSGEWALSEDGRRVWHDAVELAPYAYLLTDTAGVILDANRAAPSLFGVARQHLIGKPLAAFLSLEARRSFRTLLRKPPASGEKQELEMQLLSRDGQELDARVTLARLIPSTANQSEVTWVIHDLTPRRKVEAALRAALGAVHLEELRLDAAVKLAPVNFLTADLQLRHTLVHGPGLAVPLEALAVAHADEPSMPAGVAELLAFERSVLDGGEGARREIGLAAPDGQVVYYDATAEQLRNASGEVSGLTVLAWDATERRLASEALRLAREALLQEVAGLEAAVRQNALDLAASREQARELSRRLAEVQEQERRAIARELHDETGQALTALMLGLGAVEKEAGLSGSVPTRIAELKQMTQSAMEALHGVANQLRPLSLDRVGLVPALRQQIEAFKQQAHLDVDLEVVGLEDQRLPPDRETAIYRVVQEALTNVVRHAAAQHVGVIVERQGDVVKAIIEDDGAGFEPEAAQASGRLGLAGMRERAEMLGGSLVIESRPGRGTSVFLEVPCEC
jgi:PAS domain S-box-containing protein